MHQSVTIPKPSHSCQTLQLRYLRRRSTLTLGTAPPGRGIGTVAGAEASAAPHFETTGIRHGCFVDYVD